MVSPVPKMGRPVASFPKTVAFHFFPAVAEWRVAVRGALKIQVSQLLQICPDNLNIKHSQGHVLQLEEITIC